jgi:DNA polymerase-3 subunit delta
MIFKERQLEKVFKSPDPLIRVFLFYGTDQGLVHERAQVLLKAKVEDLNDPFRISYLTGGEIKKDPSRLMDEASAQSLVGGERVVYVKLGGEDISKAISQCLDNSNISVIIIEAGGLGPKSPVRKIIERNKNSAAIPGYLDNEHDLENLIDSTLQKHGKSIDLNGKNYLVNNLGSDRGVSRSELDKLITYMGTETKIGLDDVLLIIGDSGAFSIDKIIYPVANGNHLEAEVNLQRAFKGGQSSIAILRATIRHFHKLHLALSFVERGQVPRDAVKALKPPIMYLFTDQFVQQLNRWSRPKLDSALTLLTEAEVDCKSTGLPVDAICGRLLMRLSKAVSN